MKIISFECENVKRLKAVYVEFTGGLNTLGGNNKAGKTSILDIIMNLIGGEKYTPTNALHEGAKKGHASITTDEGVTISANYTKNGRTGLKVEGLEGEAGGSQAILNRLFGERALDISHFLQAMPKKKAQILLEMLGIDLAPLEERYKAAYDERTDVTRREKAAKGQYERMPYHEEVGTEVITASELIQQQQQAMKVNAANQHKRENLAAIEKETELHQREVTQLKAQLDRAEKALAKAISDRAAAMEATEGLEDRSTEELEQRLAEIDATNEKIRENQTRAKAESDWKLLAKERNALDYQVQQVRDEKAQLLEDADMPVPGLSVEAGEITYEGQKWDCMSTAEQYTVAAAIQARLNPAAAILLVDRLETMDIDTMGMFAAWCDEHDVQVIGTRVSTGPECDVIIEDGMIAVDAVSSEPVEEEDDMFSLN